MDYRPLTGEDIFKCQECGACCQGFGGTYVSKEDIESIAHYIDTDHETFMDNYLETSGSKYVISQGEDGNCIFYNKKKQCTIHPVKPHMCKAWPFIQTIILNPENWNIMAGSCPGMKKDVEHDILKKIVEHEIKSL